MHLLHKKTNKKDYSTIPTCPKSHAFPKHKHVLIVDEQNTSVSYNVAVASDICLSLIIGRIISEQKGDSVLSSLMPFNDHTPFGLIQHLFCAFYCPVQRFNSHSAGRSHALFLEALIINVS